VRSPQADKNPGDFVAQGSRTAIRRFNRKIPRHSESHKMEGGVLLQLTGRREGDCNGDPVPFCDISGAGGGGYHRTGERDRTPRRRERDESKKRS
jgi:hypothetical protein